MLFIIIILCGILFFTKCRYSQNRRLFINHIYFRLIDVEKELEFLELDDLSNNDEVVRQLYELDLICDIQRMYTDDAFHYDLPGGFQKIANNIQSGMYSSSEITMISENIKLAIDELSVSSGRIENNKLTYQQVSDILKKIFSNLKQLD